METLTAWFRRRRERRELVKELCERSRRVQAEPPPDYVHVMFARLPAERWRTRAWRWLTRNRRDEDVWLSLNGRPVGMRRGVPLWTPWWVPDLCRGCGPENYECFVSSRKAGSQEADEPRPGIQS